jgi:Ca-activated chloride channel family protein
MFMPARGISRRATDSGSPRYPLLALILLFASPFVCAQQQSQGQPPQQQQSQQQGTVIPSPPPPPQAQTDQGHHIKQNVDMVVVHATVTDDKGEFISDLGQDNFRVYEDRIEQRISVFTHQDVPVTMGLVIDNSGSMREKRSQVNAAALSFVKTSNPQDEVFVVNFNDEYYLDLNEDFTSDTKELDEALGRIDSRGSTALYDAVIGSLDHLRKGHKDKRVLLVITDGDDDASRKSLEYTVKASQESDAAIYAIGVFSDDDRKNDKKMVRHSKKVLTQLADSTGGMAYFPDSLDEVTSICEQVARDIRNQYTLGYYPTNTAKDGSFRTVQVQLTPPHGRGKLNVRSRTGYYAQKVSQGD